MNAVEIEQAITDLAEQPFDAGTFPYAFLEAFGNKATTLKRLQSGATNKSDLPGGLLQHNNIHLIACAPGEVAASFDRLRASPATSRHKARFILATDGEYLQAEDLTTGEPLACAFQDFPNHFGFFLSLAGITTVRQIAKDAFDIRATGKLNRLYVELLKDNPAWGASARRPDINHFMARLIFCFFAEDTEIFKEQGLFTKTVQRMSASDSSNTHEVISELFRAMSVEDSDRPAAGLRPWADAFPYVNGGLFSGSIAVPRFSRIAKSYLLSVGTLDWKRINPDIFGSMIQAIADDDERGALGMHYTSVPNILKVLNPLFLDDLRSALSEAGDNPRTLLNLRKRLAHIRVFDPACGSGNFLVIAYKEMREIEAEINARRGERHRRSDIPLRNFRGIELRDFPADIARLALIIAQYQCDVLYRSQTDALADLLPLDSHNWITCEDALLVDWLAIWPPDGTSVRLNSTDLFSTPLDQAAVDFDNAGGETYICGNPPYLGNKLQSDRQKDALRQVFAGRVDGWKSLDYVAAWLMKATHYGMHANAAAAFVTTNSICQGQQVPLLWPAIFATGHEISFAHDSFKWSNLASHNAGVIVIIVGLARASGRKKRLFTLEADGTTRERLCSNINPYLVDAPNLVVEAERTPQDGRRPMLFGNMPRDGGNLLVSPEHKAADGARDPIFASFLRRFAGSEDFIHGQTRYCLWIDRAEAEDASRSLLIAERLEAVRQMRLESKAASTRDFAKTPYRFVQIQGTARRWSFIIPRHSSERRAYLPAGLLDADTIVADSAFAIYDAPLWTMALILSRLHLVWIAAVCGKLKTDYRYSNTLGWNTFPVPTLTDKNHSDLGAAAFDILLAREAYYPATVADLYEPERFAGEFSDLKEAHLRNDEVVERIYVGRRFKNDTERLERLFALYARRTGRVASVQAPGMRRRAEG